MSVKMVSFPSFQHFATELEILTEEHQKFVTECNGFVAECELMDKVQDIVFINLYKGVYTYE